MKVKDLIEELSQYSPDMEVVTSGYEGGYAEVSSISPVEVLLNVNSEWYYGPHEEAEGFLGQNPEKYEKATVCYIR